MTYRNTLTLLVFLVCLAARTSEAAFYFVDQKIEQLDSKGILTGEASLKGVLEIATGTHVISTAGVNPFTTIDLLLTVNGKSAALDSFLAIASPYTFFTFTATESDLMLEISRSIPWPTVAALQFYSGPGSASGNHGSYTFGAAWDWHGNQHSTAFGFILDGCASVGTGDVSGPWKIGETMSVVPEPSTYFAGVGALGALLLSFVRKKLP